MKRIPLILIIILAVNTVVFAQDTGSDNHLVTFTVSATSILDIEGPGGNNAVNFAPEAISEAGTAFSFELSNSSLWLNYTNVKATDGSTRKITVGMTNDLPVGMELSVSAGLDIGNGEGSKGIPNVQAITLSDGVTSSIITGIGSAFTGDGVSNGHLLTYNLSFDDDEYQTLTTDLSNTVTITYTIIDE